MSEPKVRIDGSRLWDSLMDMAKIGATEKGGVKRLALTDLDKEGRDLFVRWCEAAGCTIRIDKVGNIFARRPGRNGDLAPVLTGSHLDSQPTGGRFDGVYGVLAGLEGARLLFLPAPVASDASHTDSGAPSKSRSSSSSL